MFKSSVYKENSCENIAEVGVVTQLNTLKQVSMTKHATRKYESSPYLTLTFRLLVQTPSCTGNGTSISCALAV